MTASSPQEISVLLQAWRDGDQESFDKLVPLVYDELHRLAHRYMRRERAGHTVQTNDLVNEAYFRLIDAKNVDWRDRAHFFAISAKLMRQVLVDLARKKKSNKRPHDSHKVPFDEAQLYPRVSDPDLVELHDALTALEQFDPRKARVVELKFFGGFDLDEISDALNVSRDTVKSDWGFAKAWLLAELKKRGRNEV